MKNAIASVAVGAAAAAALCFASPALAADPSDWPMPGSQPADVIQAHLESVGYDVVINWINNGMGVPLARCKVTGYHAPGSATTVYMDVLCHDED